MLNNDGHNLYELSKLSSNFIILDTLTSLFDLQERLDSHFLSSFFLADISLENHHIILPTELSKWIRSCNQKMYEKLMI